MMEFLLYLTPVGKELLYNVLLAKFNVQENIGLCRNHSINGSVSYPSKQFVICTDNIKRNTNNVREVVSKTVTHEAVHVVQICKNNDIIRIPNAPLLGKEKHVRLSMSLSSTMNNEYDKEYEAYLLEDYPEKVLHYVKKFCF